MTKLTSKTRENKSKQSVLKELRESGRVPVVVYGYQVENTALSVDENEFLKVIREVGRNGVIDLDLEGKPTKVMVTDYQFDSLKNQVTHIDFVAINMKTEVTVDVTVELSGEAKGAEEGGVIEQPTFQLEVTATPNNIPEYLHVDVSELEIGDTLYVSDIKIDGDYVIENDDEEAVVTVVPPQKEEEETEEGEESEETAEEDAEGSEESSESEEE
ncbi:50S ribosomal protein L25/general stress protein Ctc [Corticicoccus populi]|uniref:Large ribosomal subunit protein bL25 n=1 Tax=Corticicoccus populi TaxID=1812821 RepID=A0ABW5WZS1_9STAP